MLGLHLTADLAGCDPSRAAMTDADALRALCERAVRDAGLHPVASLFHPFAPDGAGPSPASGVTGVVLLAESHLAVHTWPEFGAVTVDAYVCNRLHDNRAAAQALLDAVVAAFEPSGVHRARLDRVPPGGDRTG